MNFVEHEVLKFKKKNCIRKVTFKKLLMICHRKGYLVSYYSNSYNYLMAAGLWKEAQTAESISTIDDFGCALIFLRDELSEDKLLFSLAHELGHIILKHKVHTEEKAENEADRFAHELLNKQTTNKLLWKFFLTILMLSVITMLLVNNHQKTNTIDNLNTTVNKQIISEKESNVSLSHICYYTKYGEVYHLYADCHYLKNSSTVRTGTVYESNKDRLCSACEKRKKDCS